MNPIFIKISTRSKVLKWNQERIGKKGRKKTPLKNNDIFHSTPAMKPLNKMWSDKVTLEDIISGLIALKWTLVSNDWSRDVSINAPALTPPTQVCNTSKQVTWPRSTPNRSIDQGWVTHTTIKSKGGKTFAKHCKYGVIMFQYTVVEHFMTPFPQFNFQVFKMRQLKQTCQNCRVFKKKLALYLNT